MLSGVLGVINTPSTAASCVVNVNLVGWWLVVGGRWTLGGFFVAFVAVGWSAGRQSAGPLTFSARKT
jgi:hypothetical protein